METDFDYVIVGAGCGGLSLAVHLLEAGVRRRVLILDPRDTFGEDRTWCFFDVADHPFADAVSHRWKRWRVADAHRDVVRGSDRHSYQHLASGAFYAAARRRIDATEGFELRHGPGHAVRGVLDRGADVVVTTDAGPVTARFVFDSRPSAAERTTPEHAEAREVNLVQHFVGWVVETQNDVFDPEIATLMDFRTRQDRGIHFTYTLPFSSRRALVEDTYFSRAPLEPAAYEESLGQYLAAAGAGDFTITHTERGAIPMTTSAFEQRPSPRVYRIGVAGGLARPATGYAFLAIQRFSKSLAAALATADPARLDQAATPPAPRSARTLLLDRCFLTYLDEHPDRAPGVFTTLFDHVPPDVLVRFLSETGSFADELHVMRSLPTLPFARSMLRALHSLSYRHRPPKRYDFVDEPPPRARP